MAALEPFRSLPADPPPLSASEPRIVYACPDHPDDLTLEAGRCPIDRKQREPGHSPIISGFAGGARCIPTVTADQPGSVCKECGGMVLKPRVISYASGGAGADRSSIGGHRRRRAEGRLRREHARDV